MSLKRILEEKNIKNENELFKYLDENKFQWGMIIDEKKETNIDSKTYFELWTLKDTEKILEDEIAICWDYANFEKNIFDELGLKSNIYYLVFNDDIENNPSHCFSVIQRKDDLVLFEYSFRKKANIYEKENIDEIINMILEWIYERFEYLRASKAIVYKFKDVLPNGINARELLDLAINQEIVFENNN